MESPQIFPEELLVFQSNQYYTSILPQMLKIQTEYSPWEKKKSIKNKYAWSLSQLKVTMQIKEF